VTTERVLVAVDGAAGSGKTTLSRRLARILGVPYINTGLMYRGLAAAASRTGTPIEDEAALLELARNLRFTLRGQDPIELEVAGYDHAALTRPEVESTVMLVKHKLRLCEVPVAMRSQVGERHPSAFNTTRWATPALDIPRATLTDRLRRLTRLQIFRQIAAETGQRKEYRLTRMGFDLYPSFIALMQFGDRWLSVGKRPPLVLIHSACGCETHPIVACSECLTGLRARRVEFRDGPGSGRKPWPSRF